MKTRKAIDTALAGVTPFEFDYKTMSFHFENVSTGNFDPPAYLVAFLFLHVLGYKDHGSMEKVWWHTYLQFKGTPYLLRDYKFGTWSLEAPKAATPDKKQIDSLLKRISTAARQADKILAQELVKQVKKGEFWINNGYRTLREAYQFYGQEVQQSRAEIERITKISIKRYSVPKRIELHNKRIQLERTHAFKLFPLIVSFYSFVEFYLALQQIIAHDRRSRRKSRHRSETFFPVSQVGLMIAAGVVANDPQHLASIP